MCGVSDDVVSGAVARVSAAGLLTVRFAEAGVDARNGAAGLSVGAGRTGAETEGSVPVVRAGRGMVAASSGRCRAERWTVGPDADAVEGKAGSAAWPSGRADAPELEDRDRSGAPRPS